MKPSHLKTPRTMNEGYWTSGYMRGSFEDQPIDWQDKVVLVGCLVVTIIFIVMAVL